MRLNLRLQIVYYSIFPDLFLSRAIRPVLNYGLFNTVCFFIFLNQPQFFYHLCIAFNGARILLYSSSTPSNETVIQSAPAS